MYDYDNKVELPLGKAGKIKTYFLLLFAYIIYYVFNFPMSDKHYYKIIDIVRKYNKPIRYFAYASATKCAEQVVVEDRKG